jgi:hypothetical protein
MVRSSSILSLFKDPTMKRSSMVRRRGRRRVVVRRWRL